MLKKVLIGIAAVFGLLVLVGIFADDPNGKPSSNAGDKEVASDEAAESAVVVKATEISKLFQENEAKAQLTYGDKTLEVTGTVKDITLDFSDAPVIKLKGYGDKFDMGLNDDGKITDVDINGLPNEVAAEINKGETHTFVCNSITEVMGGAGLSDCTKK